VRVWRVNIGEEQSMMDISITKKKQKQKPIIINNKEESQKLRVIRIYDSESLTLSRKIPNTSVHKRESWKEDKMKIDETTVLLFHN
jgi:hypothetical protein